MKPLLFALYVVFAFGALSAQTPAWQPSLGHAQVPIWPGAVPDARPVTGPETIKMDAKDLVAGRPWVYINNVSRPTMTFYSPKGKNTGAAVVVFPGGGYQILAIDPHKIGVLGFSAGGHLVAAMSTHFAKRLYPAVDAADKESCRPDFAVAIYPGHLSLSAAEWDAKQGTRKFVVPHPANADKDLGLNPEIPVTRQTPPTFLLQAENDDEDNVNDSLAYYIALKNAGVPVEMHLYAQGGHAFGLRRTKLPITGWPQLVETWLETIGIIPE